MFWMRNVKVDSWKLLWHSVIALPFVDYGSPAYAALAADRNACLSEFGALETLQWIQCEVRITPVTKLVCVLRHSGGGIRHSWASNNLWNLLRIMPPSWVTCKVKIRRVHAWLIRSYDEDLQRKLHKFPYKCSTVQRTLRDKIWKDIKLQFCKAVAELEYNC
jgi:hypothetical protein